MPSQSYGSPFSSKARPASSCRNDPASTGDAETDATYAVAPTTTTKTKPEPEPEATAAITTHTFPTKIENKATPWYTTKFTKSSDIYINIHSLGKFTAWSTSFSR